MSQTMMSVSSLNNKIKSLLEATFMHTLVEGEVASATYHTSGHLYFSIKDDKSSLKCVMWRSAVSKMKFRIEKGMHIVVEGSVSVYVPRGEYQFQAVRIEPYGQGALALAYEQLKTKLKEKGYFDAQRKKPIPKYIKKIALVTAKDSAALHDMLKVIEKRWPLLEVVIVDALVQGDSAKDQIAKSLKYADSLSADVVVVSRGGGSTEDLWTFNEEVVADAIFAMQTPVVSAVGHEVDTLISDFVADLRAPTPSAAMEMILPDIAEIRYLLDEASTRMKQYFTQRLSSRLISLEYIEASLRRLSPKQKLKAIEEQFDSQHDSFRRVISQNIQSMQSRLPRVEEGLRQQSFFVLQKKLFDFQHMKEQLASHNPKLKTKEGWGEIIVDSKRVALKNLKKDTLFLIQDTDTKVEAKVLSVIPYSKA